MCHIIDISQGGVVFQKQLQKHVISGPFGLFYVPHNFSYKEKLVWFLWVNAAHSSGSQFGCISNQLKV